MLQRIFSKNKRNEENNLYRLDRHKIRKIKKLLHTIVKRDGKALITDGITSDGIDVFIDYIFSESSSIEHVPVFNKENIGDVLKEIPGLIGAFNTEESEVLNIEIFLDQSCRKWAANITVKYPGYFSPVKDDIHAGI